MSPRVARLLQKYIFCAYSNSRRSSLGLKLYKNGCHRDKNTPFLIIAGATRAAKARKTAAKPDFFAQIRETTSRHKDGFPRHKARKNCP